MNLKKISTLLLLASIFGNSNILSASAVTLYEANQSTGDRTYTITDGTEYIGQSLGRTGAGVFNVSGNSTNSILSGYINGSLTSQGSLTKAEEQLQFLMVNGLAVQAISKAEILNWARALKKLTG